MNSPGSNYFCPNCDARLVSLPYPAGVAWQCRNCKGQAIGLNLLKDLTAPHLIAELWRKAIAERLEGGKNCPACRKPTLIVHTPLHLGHVELDVCRRCQFLWFDHEEMEKLPTPTPAERRKREELSKTLLVKEKAIPSSSGADPLDAIDVAEGVFDLLDLLNIWF